MSGATLTDEQFAACDRIELALEQRPGRWFSASQVARLAGVKLSTDEAHDLLAWLDEDASILAEGNGAWRRYSHGKPGAMGNPGSRRRAEMTA